MEARGGGAIIAMSSLGSFRVIENYTLVGRVEGRARGGDPLPRRSSWRRSASASTACRARVVETGALEHFPNREEMLRSGRDRTPAGRLLVPQDLANAVALLARRRRR